MGAAKQVCELTVTTPPGPLARPNPPHVIEVTSSTLHLGISVNDTLLRGNTLESLHYYVESDTKELGHYEPEDICFQPEITLRNLRPACPYHIRVALCGSHGNSPLSAPLVVVTKPAPPSVPTSLRMGKLESDHSLLTFARVDWNPPVCDNGSPVMEYTVELALKAKRPQFTLVERTPHCTCILHDLLPGATYIVRVQASNALGVSNMSEILQFSAGSSTPDVMLPPVLSRHPTDKQAIISWSEPTSNGSAIIGYHVILSPGDRDYMLSDVRSLTLSKLNSETEYTVVIAARNAVGEGPFSDPLLFSTDRRMAGVPSIPRFEQPQIHDRSVHFTWSADADLESPIMK